MITDLDDQDCWNAEIRFRGNNLLLIRKRFNHNCAIANCNHSLFNYRVKPVTDPHTHGRITAHTRLGIPKFIPKMMPKLLVLVAFVFDIVTARIITVLKPDNSFKQPVPLLVINESFVSKTPQSLVYIDKSAPQYNIFDAFTNISYFKLSNPVEPHTNVGPLYLYNMNGTVICNVQKFNPTTKTAMICPGNSDMFCYGTIVSKKLDPISLDIDVYNQNTKEWVSVKVFQGLLDTIRIYLMTGKNGWQQKLIAILKPIKVVDEEYLVQLPGRDNHFMVSIAPGVDSAFIMMITARLAKIQAKYSKA